MDAGSTSASYVARSFRVRVVQDRVNFTCVVCDATGRVSTVMSSPYRVSTASRKASRSSLSTATETCAPVSSVSSRLATAAWVVSRRLMRTVVDCQRIAKMGIYFFTNLAPHFRQGPSCYSFVKVGRRLNEPAMQDPQPPGDLAELALKSRSPRYRQSVAAMRRRRSAATLILDFSPP